MTPFRLLSGIARLLLLLAPFLAWWWFIAHVDEMTLMQFARLLGINIASFWLGLWWTVLHYHSRGYFQG